MDNIDTTSEFLHNYFEGIEPGEVINIRYINDYGVKNEDTDLNNVMELLKYDNIRNRNTYFNLSTFKDNSTYKTENVGYRYSIAFDWDLKDYLGCDKEYLQALYRENRPLFDDYKKELLTDIYKRVNGVGGLYLHYVIDSGYGYHAYLFINKSNDIEKVTEVQGALIKLLKSDIQCKDMVRVLRVPNTLNVKGNNNVYSKIVQNNVTDNPKFARYDIDRLYDRFCTNKSKYEEVKYNYGYTDIELKSTYICIEKALKEGSQQHHKNDDLVNIVVYLKNKGYSLEQIHEKVKEWDSKSDYNDMTEYRVNYIYHNQNTYDFKCDSCLYKGECNKRVKIEFEQDDEFGTIVIEDKVSKLLKKPKNKKYKEVKGKGDKMVLNELSGNELLLINMLKYHGEMNTSRFMKELTFRKRKKVKNVAMSEPTFIKTTKSLAEKGIIEIVKGNARAGIENSYKLNLGRCKIENTIEIGYMVNILCLVGAITPSELKLYHLMRYIQKQQQAESNKFWSGALLRINQSELAQWYYGSDSASNKGHISDMIEGLIEAKILQVYSIDRDDKGREYYTYKMVK